jgi:hypothetical protein
MSDPTPDPAPAVPPPADPVPADQPPDDPMDKELGAGYDLADPHSPLAPLYASVTGILGVALVAAFTVLYTVMPMQHTDIWAHLKYGQHIAEHRELPAREPLSPFTDQSAVMYHQCWLSQVIYAGAFGAGQSLGGADPVKRFLGGVEVLRQVHVLALAGMFAALWVAFRRSADSGSLALLGLLLVFFGGFTAIGAFRPQVFGLVMFAVFLAILSRPVLSKAAVVAVPLLLLVWVNLHGTFAVGFGLLGMAWVGRVVEAALAGNGGRVKAVFADTNVRRLTLAIALALGAACLNPAGPAVYLNVLSFGKHPNLKTLLEWEPISFTEAGKGGPLYLALAGLVVLLNVLAGVFARTRLRAEQYLMLAVFAAAPFLQQRMMTWWLMVGVWLMMPPLGALAGRWKLVWRRSTPSLRKTVLAVVVVAPFLFLNPLTTWIASGKPPERNKQLVDATPVELAAVLENPKAYTGERLKPLAEALKADYTGRTLGPLFCSSEVGEYVLWKQIPGAPPVRYTHAHLFPEEHWMRCHAAAGGERWEECMDRLGVNVIAVEPDYYGPLVSAVSKSERWKVVAHETGGKEPRARLFVAVRKLSK